MHSCDFVSVWQSNIYFTNIENSVQSVLFEFWMLTDVYLRMQITCVSMSFKM